MGQTVDSDMTECCSDLFHNKSELLHKEVQEIISPMVFICCGSGQRHIHLEDRSTESLLSKYVLNYGNVFILVPCIREN